MKILDFIKHTKLDTLSESERAKLLCYYHYKTNNEKQFNMSLVSDLMIKFGFNTPNTSRLKNNLIKGKNKAFIPIKGSKNEYEFIPAHLQTLEKEYKGIWNDSETIESSSELIDETKFCGKRQYLDKLIKQINHTYAHNCYDACAVLMRRLFEVMLILSYQKLGIDNEIKDSSGNEYVMLEKIVTNAKNNATLNLSRIKSEFDTFRKVGNFSAHGITYTAGQKDIGDIKLDYRRMLEELYNKAGLI